MNMQFTTKLIDNAVIKSASVEEVVRVNVEVEEPINQGKRTMSIYYTASGEFITAVEKRSGTPEPLEAESTSDSHDGIRLHCADGQDFDALSRKEKDLTVQGFELPVQADRQQFPQRAPTEVCKNTHLG